MLNLLPASRLTTFGISHLGGRNYDYTEIYSANKQGEEAKENPRVWNVCLDEAENHDVDMIQGFLNIIDSLLVFAALFSEVVTTFVAQTSQVLRPDNAQIMVSLLIETNQLLRAVGNKTTISAVPAASLGLQSQTYTSVDVWVNGLFFTSLVLSLSTALLSVLAKQWIQAYTAIVPGSAKAHTLVRHFRFKGLVKWKLNDIIESLPLILHCSVAIFLVWLTLYVSQLSHPICGVVAGITACTFIFYLGSSMIPAIDGACPYRIPFMFSIAQLLLFAVYTTLDKCWNLWHILIQKSILGPQQTQWDILAWRSTWSLKKTEHNEASRKLLYTMDLAFDSLDWVTNQSSNPSGKEVIVEGTCGLLDDLSTSNAYIQPPIFSLEDSLFVFAITYSLSRLPDIYSTSSMVDKIGESTMYG